MNPKVFLEVMKEVEERAAKQPRATPERLAELAAAYFDRHAFQPGDVVMWKPGLKAANLPDYSEPAVVLAVRSGMVDSDGGLKDVYIGAIDKDGDLIKGAFDGALFMPYREETPFEKTLSESMEDDTQPSAPAEAVDAFAGHVSPTAQYKYSGDDPVNDPVTPAPPEAHDQPETRPNWHRDPDPIAEHDRPAAYPKWPANN